MEIAKKIGWLLMTAILVTLSLPAHVVLAQGTTVEVNNGSTIVLNAGQAITGSDSGGIPVDVKGIVVSANATGLAAVDFTLNWNPAVIRVDRVVMSTAASALGWRLTVGAINHGAGTVEFLGTTTGGDTGYSKANLTLAYLGITAVGGRGGGTTITVTIANLVDNKLQEITPRTPVNAPVQIRAGAGTLVSIELVPTDPSVAPGLTQQFTATGILDDKSSADITDKVTWASSNTTVATISTAGLATSLIVGTTTIRATLGTIYATATLTVTKAETEVEVVTPPPSEEKKVEAVTPPPSEEEKPGTTTPSAEEKTATTLPPAAELPPAVTPKVINWQLISGIVAGVVLLGLASYFLVRRRAS